jgi:hypothetical protein
LFVATFLTLLYLPGLYALWFRKSLGERGVGEQGAASEVAAPHHGHPHAAIPLAEAAE